MNNKKCTTCKIEQPITNFHKYKNSVDGHTHRCKKCVSRKQKLSLESKTCKCCGEEKPFENFNKRKNGRFGYNSICKLCNNKKKVEWREKNKSYYLEYKKNYNMNRKKSDPSFKLKSNLRCRLHGFLQNRKISKNNKTLDIIGCTPQELIQYLEKKFTDDMSWENYGYYGWHVDHIIPISSANKISDIYKIFHFTNLQPLWAEDNMKKSNKYES
jgi:hypothetical protein